MITYDDVLIHESIVMSHIKGSDDTPTEAEIHTLAFITELKKAFPPVMICGKCPYWEQTDDLKPSAGKCHKRKKGGQYEIRFNYEECAGGTDVNSTP